MLRFTQLVDDEEKQLPSGVLTLRFEDRRRSRLRARLDDGREAALILPHGTVLRDGDRLRDGASGAVVTVSAAAQILSHVRSDDPLLLARAAYHLGNRHVPVQLGEGWLAYERDHVLDGMVGALGLTVETRVEPFEPEGGGYGQGRTAGREPHGHLHDHSHGHGH